MAAIVATFLGLGATLPTQAAPRTAARWQYIHYPQLEIPNADGEKITVLVGLNFPNEQPRLRCDVLWSGRSSVEPPDAIKKAGEIVVRLHPSHGAPVEPTNEPEKRTPPGISGGGSTTYSRIFFFPWGPNKLEEAWLECRIVTRTYWIEVPYGFTRDPSATLSPAEPDAGLPAIAPAMKEIPPADQIVPWSTIEYDLGLIERGWRLSVAHANSPESQWWVTLYREDGAWELNKPETSAKIVDDGGGTITAKQVGVRLPDPFRRVDEYSFPTFPSEGRDWGTLIISVGGKATTATIPSSLFKDGHGVGEPSHPQRRPSSGGASR